MVKRLYAKLSIMLIFVTLYNCTFLCMSTFSKYAKVNVFDYGTIEQIYVCGEQADISLCSFYENELIMFSITKLSEKLGYNCKISDKNIVISLTEGDKRKLNFEIGSNFAILNDVQRVILDVPPIYKDDAFLSKDTLELCFNLCVDIDWERGVINIRGSHLEKGVSDFEYLFYNMDTKEIISVSGNPDTYSENGNAMVYNLSNGRKIYLYDYGKGKLEDIVLEDKKGNSISTGYHGIYNLVDFERLPTEYKNDNSAVFDRSERFMTRADVAIFIMLALGARSYGGTGYENMYDILVCDSISDNWYERCICSVDDSYLIEYAAMHAGIIYGERTCGKDGKQLFFNESRFATLSEIMAIMIRCLKPDGVELKNLNSTFAAGEKLGLIKENDEFYGHDSILTLDEFKTVLNRFLEQPRGIYHNPSGIYDVFTYSFDEKRSKTYSDHLSDIYLQNYDNLLLNYDGYEPWDNYIKKNLGSYDPVRYCNYFSSY